jgi:GT2 family glycosyltransferase
MRAPVAVRIVDLERPRDLDLSRDGDPYRSVLVVARRGGRPVASTVLALDDESRVSSDVLQTVFAGAHDAVEQDQELKEVGAEPTVSAVVTTCGRSGSVVATVASILACRPAALEVVVVENRPSGSTVAQALAEQFGIDERVRYVPEPRIGLSWARNAGLGVVRGEVVAFTDDDVLVDGGWIGWIARAFASEPDAACVTGLILPQDLEGAAQVRVEQFAGFGKGVQRRVHRVEKPTSPLFPYAAGEFGSGASTALRSSLARSIGGFDTTLGAGTIARGAEDLDLYVRVLLANRAIVYEPAAIVWHRHRDEPGELRRKAFGYGVSLTAMLTKQMINGHSRAILYRIPAAARFLRDPNSRKNDRKGPDYPRRYDWIERGGMCAGPLAYFVSRGRERRIDARVATSSVEPFSATWVTEVDLTAPPLELRAPGRPGWVGGGEFTRARVLVRREGEPVGLVSVPVQDGVIGASTLQATLARTRTDPDAAPAAPTLKRTLPAMGVVLCTRDRPQSLMRAIESILLAADAHTEVLVVDSAPETDATARSIAQVGDPRVRRILEPIPGLARARNRGLAEIDRDLVAFTDDDVIVDSAWLAALARGFERSDRVACVTGLVPAAELETTAQAFFEAKVKWSATLRPRLFDLGEHRGEGRLYPFTSGDIGAGANFAVRRSQLATSDNFDEALGVGTPAQGGEDLDFFARTVLAGGVIAFEPAAIVWHFHRREAASLRAQMYGYGSGLTAYAFKHVVSGSAAGHLLRDARSYRRRPSRRPRVQSRHLPASAPPGLRRAEVRGMLAGPVLYVLGRYTRARRTPVERSS